jgi:hypothetical protein
MPSPSAARRSTERGDEGVARIRELTSGIGADAVLADDPRPARHRLISLGRYELRGVRRPQELFTIDPEDRA